VKRGLLIAGAGLVAVALAIALWMPSWTREAGTEPKGDVASAPARPPAAPAATPPATPNHVAREPATGATLTFDLRGPGDAALSCARLIARGDSRAPIVLPWSRATPAVVPPATACTIVAEAESRPCDVPCGDLVSEPYDFDPHALPSQPVVLALHARRGVFGRLLNVPAGASCEVRWRPAAAQAGPVDLVLGGRAVPLAPLDDGGSAYVVHDMAPGRYVVGVRADLAGPFEVVREFEVSDAMVRLDLSLAAADTVAMLHVLVRGLAPEDLGRVSFQWIGGSPQAGRGDAMRQRSDAAGSFWVAPSGDEARDVLRRLLDGIPVNDANVAIALVSDGAVTAAQPIRSGTREVVFECDAEARLRVTFKAPAPAPDDAGLRVVIVPAAAADLLQGPETMLAGSRALASGGEIAFARLVPGDFVVSVWGQVHSDLNHAEVWWPLERRAIALHAGDQEIALGPPPLEPLTIRFDRALFGKAAQVQLVRKDYAKWPIYAVADADGIARFSGVPAGDYTATVIGDTGGSADLTMPGAGELWIRPERREDH